MRPSKPAPESLDTFLRRQSADDLVEILLELAEHQEPVRERLARLQLAAQPEKLAAGFRRTLAGWRRSTRFHAYREARAYARKLEDWLGQVERELLPTHPALALSLFEAFIEADSHWFEHADDSDGAIGDAMREACRLWLAAAARCQPPSEGWTDRLIRLAGGDGYGARESLLRHSNRLLDAPAQRAMVAHYEALLDQILVASANQALPTDVFSVSGTLGLLAESLGDPDVKVRATLRYSPDPNPLQREAFVKAYLAADRPADALAWLDSDWEHWEGRRQTLRAEALARLGRHEESAPIRRQVFDRTLSRHDLDGWLEQLPESAREPALAEARALAISHADPIAAATLLASLDDIDAAEQKLIADPTRVDGRHYAALLELAKTLHDRERLRGEALAYRALLTAILERGYSPAYGYAARYWRRLVAIAQSGASLAPLESHEAFEARVRAAHGRKTSFWSKAERPSR